MWMENDQDEAAAFERPTGTRLPPVTDSSSLRPVLQRNEKRLEGWREHGSIPHLFSANSASGRSRLFASALKMAVLWRLRIKVTLGSYES